MLLKSIFAVFISFYSDVQDVIRCFVCVTEGYIAYLFESVCSADFLREVFMLHLSSIIRIEAVPAML